jgi:predicted short-subunit dehydrogenase-like oxidoreductase (DUF2520 family)
MNPISFSIIGAGRLGTCLARALTGSKFKLEGLFSPHCASARESHRLIGHGMIYASLQEAVHTADIVFLTVRDDTLQEVIQRISSFSLNWQKRHIFHCSGFHPASILAPLRRKGALIASLHPIQSFPRKNLPPHIFHKIFFTFEGDDKARPLAEQIVEALGGQLIALSPGKKPLYHTACSLASNYLVGLLYASMKLLQEAGYPLEKAVAMLLPLSRQTLENIQSLGLPESLTGPLQRGDIHTVASQLDSLKASPQIKKIFIALSHLLLEISENKGCLSPEERHQLRRLLEEK